MFVETLDRCFKNVCELDIVYNFNKVESSSIYVDSDFDYPTYGSATVNAPSVRANQVCIF